MTDRPTNEPRSRQHLVEDTRLTLRQKKQLVAAILVIFFAPIFLGLIYTAATG